MTRFKIFMAVLGTASMFAGGIILIILLIKLGVKVFFAQAKDLNPFSAFSNWRNSFRILTNKLNYIGYSN